MRRPLVLLGGGTAAALAVVLWLSSTAAATPADPTVRVVRQPDGTTFSARLWGDEYLNGLETAAGYTVVRGAGGRWVFAAATPDGQLTPTTIRPDRDGRPPEAAGIAPHLRDELALDAAQAERAEAAGSGTEATGDGTPPATGTQPVLVVLTEFTDRSLSTTDADWADLFFGPTQSVADYYDAASYGSLTLAPATETSGTVDDGVIRVSLDRAHPDSGSAFGSFQSTARAAIAAIDGHVDLAAYDAAGDGDGSISPDELHVAIVVAGREASQSCAGPTVWGHRSSLGNPVAVGGVGGVIVGDADDHGGYFAAGELQCPSQGEQQATLGIWVHELGHDLGWIDLYDIDGSSRGVDSWSLMGIHWLALPGEPIGARPPLPDPFSRWQVGWVTPTPVTTVSDDVPLASSAVNDDVLQVGDNPDGVDIDFLSGGGAGEYFLVENRRQEGYDVALAGCGALVWHIDESRFNLDDGARRVDVEEAGAGNDQYGSADEEDPFPSSVPANGTFGPTTRPNSNLNRGLPSGVTLTDFSEACGPTITLDVDPGGPVTGAPTNDRLADARIIRLRDTGAREVRGHNVDATHQPGEPRHAGVEGTGSVWWSFRAPRDGYLSLTSESTAREVVAVYTGNRITNLTPVAVARGGDPSGGSGSPPGHESLRRALGFPVERQQRYLIAVDSLLEGETTGIRLFVDYDEATLDAGSIFRTVGPGQRPILAVTVRNTSRFLPLRVDGFANGVSSLVPVDCPSSFRLDPGRSRRCHVRPPATGTPGTQLRGRLLAFTRWPAMERYATLTDPWFVRVRQ